MPELTTTVAAAGAIGYIGKDLVGRVLGPSADYLGGQLQLFTEKNVENLKKIFEAADEIMPKNDIGNAMVSPRIIKDVIFEGSFCEDEVSQKYYAGVLASSKTEDIIDNRGVWVLDTINNLSSYQLKAHYLLYAIFWAKLSEESYSDIRRETMIENWFFLRECFNLDYEDKTNSQAILEHILYGLQDLNLLKGMEQLNSTFQGLSVEGQYHYLPTARGIELFLWANGYGKKPIDYFCSKEFSPRAIENIDIHRF